jgi:hypothetical protein
MIEDFIDRDTTYRAMSLSARCAYRMTLPLVCEELVGFRCLVEDALSLLTWSSCSVRRVERCLVE